MIVKYNGIDLQIEHIQVFDQRDVYAQDGSRDYLFTHFRLRVVFIWNPEATSAVSGGTKQQPAFSIQALRHALLQPRKLLQVRFNGQQILESPLLRPDGNSRYLCDCNNGPAPVSCDVQAFHGIQSAVGVWEVETWINECPNGREILSHRWTMSADVDQDNYTTRTVQGEVIFRPDLLLEFGAKPDDYRASIFHPIPVNFQRINIHVEADSDGTSLSYSFQDEEQTLKLVPGWSG
ncbi:MAG TPA: hypothetical protein VNX28_08725, partial [Gemmataceae bacterium]|nr:hypothetical protein [Gemmataceae bacterium]